MDLVAVTGNQNDSYFGEPTEAEFRVECVQEYK